MKAAAGLCVLGLLCLHSGGLLGQDLEDQPEVLVFCDDPAVDAAAKAAMTSFNERVVTGYQLALYQILSASKAVNDSGVVYSMKFNSRKSDCPAGGAVPWSDCGYLADGVKEPRPCNATVYVSEGDTSTLSVECSLEDSVVPERVSCLGCPVEIDPKSEDLKGPLALSISKYNGMTDTTHLFMLNSVMAGLRYRLHFDLRKSNCSKADHPQLHPACLHDDDDVPVGFSRRRPPGWSPLRKVVETKEVPIPKASSSVSPEPSPALAPEEPSPALAPEEPSRALAPESSEEEDGAKEDPFRCPSPPWKTFTPDVVLSDTDLLG
ncbi:hypothetical protein NHX12_033056 [Muraenolepis orangiensis]|uniref:Cystatin kininogen-type domain-containing protein n=1 Tax=Muraenolepis orangiensis TaxID=630683 RepID=A0A9Q0E371_9TELE|nr:hypothetical protein NHX12_033056 [Muraenolepis orangiensis]